MTNAPNMKPDSVSTDPAKPISTPAHDARKTAPFQPKVEPKVEPKPAPKV